MIGVWYNMVATGIHSSYARAVMFECILFNTGKDMGVV